MSCAFVLCLLCMAREKRGGRKSAAAAAALRRFLRARQTKITFQRRIQDDEWRISG